MLSKLNDEGRDGVGHHPPFESDDLHKLYQYLAEEDVDSPKRIGVKVFER